MEVATQAIADFLTENLDGIDASVVAANTADYLEQLTALDERIAAAVGALPSERRVLVTSHEVFGYFAERYDFTVVGTVVPSGSTADGSSAGALAELADVIRDQDVPAIFSDTSSSDELAQTLAAEVGAVEVIALYSESLGAADSDGATYIEMMQANADRITDALAP
jgi:zinc/manganese transport system substrate-binding protein